MAFFNGSFVLLLQNHATQQATTKLSASLSAQLHQHHSVLFKQHCTHITLPTLHASEHAYIQNLIVERGEFLLGRATKFAYLLDPRYTSDPATQGLDVEATEAIINGMAAYVVEAKLGDGAIESVVVEEMTTEYAQFAEMCRGLRRRESSTLKSLATGGTPVLQFWRLHGQSYPNLKVVALRVFSVTASSAASERNFSTMGFIHSKLRNALGAEKVEKLVYIKTNYPQLPKHDGAFWEDDAEEEESSGDGQETGEMEV
jgi:hypothetical protein